MINFSVDESRCTRCGMCELDCVAGIIHQRGNRAPTIDPENERKCFKCQHCLAVCPSGAISILGKSPENSQAINPESFPSFEKMSALVRGRRSIRHYRQENVEPRLIEELLRVLAYVPTGANACGLTFTVIDKISAMERIQKSIIAEVKASPRGKNISERYAAMVALPEEKLKQQLFRGAPHAIIASAPPTVPCASEDTALAIAQFDLLAHSAGLGCVWWGFLRLICSISPSIKAILGIPEDHIFSAALFGYPVIKFARIVQKDEAESVRRISQ